LLRTNGSDSGRYRGGNDSISANQTATGRGHDHEKLKEMRDLVQQVALGTSRRGDRGLDEQYQQLADE